MSFKLTPTASKKNPSGSLTCLGFTLEGEENKLRRAQGERKMYDIDFELCLAEMHYMFEGWQKKQDEKIANIQQIIKDLNQNSIQFKKSFNSIMAHFENLKVKSDSLQKEKDTPVARSQAFEDEVERLQSSRPSYIEIRDGSMNKVLDGTDRSTAQITDTVNEDFKKNEEAVHTRNSEKVTARVINDGTPVKTNESCKNGKVQIVEVVEKGEKGEENVTQPDYAEVKFPEVHEVKCDDTLMPTKNFSDDSDGTNGNTAEITNVIKKDFNKNEEAVDYRNNGKEVTASFTNDRIHVKENDSCGKLEIDEVVRVGEGNITKTEDAEVKLPEVPKDINTQCDDMLAVPRPCDIVPSNHFSDDLSMDVTPEEALSEKRRNQEVYKKFKAILNQLTPQKLTFLINELKQLEINTQECLETITDLIFEKATGETSCPEMCAAICHKLSSLKVPVALYPSQSVNFRALIINKCQNQFETDLTVDEVLNLEKEYIDCSDPVKKKELQLTLREEKRRVRMRSLGNITFIGELYKVNMLTYKIMIFCMKCLIDKSDEKNIECLCKLLTTIGAKIKTDVMGSSQLDNIFMRLEEIVAGESNEISNHVVFMIQDVIALRKRKWGVKCVTWPQSSTSTKYRKKNISVFRPTW